jgi:hypothetical protein
MNWMHRHISKRTFMIIFNIMGAAVLWFGGAVKADLESIIAVPLTFIIMNLVAWRSTKDFPDWK